MAPFPPCHHGQAQREPGSKCPCYAFFLKPGYLDPGSAAHHPRVALRAPEGKLVPGPRCGADPGMLRCARDGSRDACDAYAITLSFRGREEQAACAAVDRSAMQDASFP